MNIVSALFGQFATRATRMAVAVFIGGLLCLTGFGWAMAACMIYLAGIYGALAACAILSGCCLVLGAAVLVGMAVFERRRRRIEDDENRRTMLLAAATQIVPAMVKASPIGSLVLAAAAAHIVGRLR